MYHVLQWCRRALAGTLDTVEPIAHRLAGGLGVEDVLLPSPHPEALRGVWIGFIPGHGHPARLHLTGHGTAEMTVAGASPRDGAWAVAGSRRSPWFHLELSDEAEELPPMRERLTIGPGDRPRWWRWGEMLWFSEQALEYTPEPAPASKGRVPSTRATLR